jgi:hypothetical protein
MATFVPPPVELLSLVLCGDDKRRVNFRIVRSNAPGNEYQFGLMECFYCDKHLAWHAQHNEAYVPISEWSKLVSYTEHVDAVAKQNADHLVNKNSNADGEENETMPAKPIKTLDEWIPHPNPIQTLDEQVLRQYGYATGSGPTGR